MGVNKSHFRRLCEMSWEFWLLAYWTIDSSRGDLSRVEKSIGT